MVARESAHLKRIDFRTWFFCMLGRIIKINRGITFYSLKKKFIRFDFICHKVQRILSDRYIKFDMLCFVVEVKLLCMKTKN